MVDLRTEIPMYDDDFLAQALAQEVEAATMINFYWYLRSWDAGKDPPCCPKCAGLRYAPQPMRGSWSVKTAPVAIAEGYVSCETAAAMHTAHKRADGFKNLVGGGPYIEKLGTAEGLAALDAVKKAYVIELEPEGPSYWHVVSIDEGERHDSTEELERG